MNIIFAGYKKMLVWQNLMSTGPIFREVAGKFDLWRSRRWRSGFKSDTDRNSDDMSAESEGDVAAELGTNCNLGKTMASQRSGTTAIRRR